ncbi:transcription termination/antitermination protein NusG [Haploplasma axanthum]|uniref:Transcription termination/antitermination protein NusG n=1 Tax=Haploplasma axanthum TaxID=29552 RepID=A0A449BCL6_HAPAX|nr:transcription termination/antitermination protein NusG [Haploplasma axanthum]VEU80189.1 Transcription antitermination protein nusG [Haploplasma axanthum]
MTKRKRWYIVQTYSGYENSVKNDLKRRIESMGMSDLIFDVIVPEEIIIEKKADGSDKEKVKQLFPGYVFVEMIETDESWYVVRNTPRVTGFLGSSGGGTKPVPLEDGEMDSILYKIGIKVKPTFEHLIGKTVEIQNGPYAGQRGKVSFVDVDKEILKVDIEFFGRATPTEVDIDNVKEIL